jgi:hypothetical protein
MKKISKILLIGAAVMALIVPLSAFAKRTEPITGRDKKLFVVRTERKLVGGKVEILSASGELVASQTLQKRKMFIDFSDVKQGLYTIRVSKGNEVKEFQFEK